MLLSPPAMMGVLEGLKLRGVCMGIGELGCISSSLCSLN